MALKEFEFIYRGNLASLGAFNSQFFLDAPVPGNLVKYYFKAESVLSFTDSWYIGLKQNGTDILVGAARLHPIAADLEVENTALSISLAFGDRLVPTVDARGLGSIVGPIRIIIVIDDLVTAVSIGDDIGGGSADSVLYLNGLTNLGQDPTRFAYQETAGNQGSLKLGNVSDATVDSGIDKSKALVQVVDQAAYNGNLGYSYFGIFSSINRSGNNSFFQTAAIRGRARYSGSSPDGPVVTGGEFFSDNIGSTNASISIQGVEGIATANENAENVQGVGAFANVSAGKTITDFCAGVYGVAVASATSVVPKFLGLFYQLWPGGTIAQLAGILVQVRRFTAGTITDLFGIKIGDWDGSTTGVTNSYGIYIDSSIDVGGTIKRAIKSLSTSISEFAGEVHVPDDAYDATTWNANTAVPTKNAVRDEIETIVSSVALKALDSAVVHNTGAEAVAGVKTFSSTPLVPDDAYDSTSWDGNLGVPTKNAVRDKIETLILAGGYSDEQAQDAIGAMLADTATIDFTYTDATPELKADVKDASITLAKMANLAASSILGNNTGSAATPIALTPSQVRALLGLVIGTDVQAYDAALTALSNALSDLADPGANAILYWNDSTNRFEFLTAGTNITISGGTISSSGGGGGMSWSEVTGATQAMAVNHGYILNNASQVVATLPSVAAVGDIVAVTGKGAGGWQIAQNAGQKIIWDSGAVAGTNESTAGTGGHADSTDQYDALEVICITANTTWLVRTSKGSISLT